MWLIALSDITLHNEGTILFSNLKFDKDNIECKQINDFYLKNKTSPIDPSELE